MTAITMHAPPERDRAAPDAGARLPHRFDQQVLLVSYSDLKGGAARAAFRLLQGLNGAGVDSSMFVLDAASGEPTVVAPSGRAGRLLVQSRLLLDRLPLVLAPRRQALFSPGWAPDGMRRRIDRLAPDLVHLHWINGGAMRVGTLGRLGRPLVWTLHDMWPFTGGCHYDGGCGRYQAGCGRCPVLGSSRALDLSSVGLSRKRRAWRGLELHIVTPSRWLRDRAAESALFAERPITVIPYGLDLGRFRPIDQHLARDLLGLPQERRLVMFGAASSDLKDLRKGWDLLESALRHGGEGLAEKTDLMLVGRPGALRSAALGVRVHALGELHDELSMVLAIAAADLVVVPSREDNLPNMAIETAACGRPCLAFRIGGLPEIIDHRTTGFLAPPFDPPALAEGLSWILDDRERWHRLGQQARLKAEGTFALSNMVQAHLDLYQSVLADAGSDGCSPGSGR